MGKAELDVAAPSVRFDSKGVRIFRRDQASSYGWWGNLAVVLGRQPPAAEHVANYRACVTELTRLHPRGIGLITVVNDTSLPSASGREAMIQMFRELWPTISVALFVPNATGFQAAIMRSVMGALILASGQRDRIRVETSVEVGLPWLATRLLGTSKAQQLLPLIERGVREFCLAESRWKADD